MLLNDAVAEGLVICEQGKRDRRCRRYRLTPAVVNAWERLIGALGSSLSEVLTEFDAGALANVDYREWNPAIPAALQKRVISPTRRKRS